MNKKVCSIKGCDTPYNRVSNFNKRNKYYCRKHNERLKKHNSLDLPLKKIKKCSVFGCKEQKNIWNYKDKGLFCAKHKQQLIDHKRILIRTRSTKNQIIKRKSYAEIFLYDINGIKISKTKIDLEDVVKVKDYKWCLNKNREVRGRLKGTSGKYIFLHRLLLDAKKGEIVDHKNRNPLDNRKRNIHICSNTWNSINTKIPKNNTSGVVGVYWIKNHKTWGSRIKFNYKNIHLGSFKNKQDAIRVRK